MSFKLPDLIVESVLRDGFENARRDNSVIDDVFCSLTQPYASKKYGVSEIEKIKKIINDRELGIVNSFSLTNANIPCISIQLADDHENEERAHLGNYRKVGTRKKTGDALIPLEIVSAFSPVAYDLLSGKVTIDDSVNLSQVYANLLFIDSTGTEFPILGGIVNDPGEKQFYIGKGLDAVSLLPGATVRSSIDYDQFKIEGNLEQTQLIVGIHTKEPLLTKYVYILVKYFLLSRRHDLIARGLTPSTYSGSDFARAEGYAADAVFTRFINISGQVSNEWNAEKVQLIDSVQVKVLVPKDRLTNEQLSLTNQTIQLKE